MYRFFINLKTIDRDCIHLWLNIMANRNKGYVQKHVKHDAVICLKKTKKPSIIYSHKNLFLCKFVLLKTYRNS